jgi:nucleotidyltransferase substrate binding protein (TIGR01987 family)
MNNNERWHQRLQNFQNAYAVFHRRRDDYLLDSTSEAYQMALVQAFEILVELSWNVLKDYLENEGVTDLNTPKSVLRAAFQAEFISDGEGWMDSIRYRNLTSHTYNLKTLQEVLTFIVTTFAPNAEHLNHTLQQLP